MGTLSDSLLQTPMLSLVCNLIMALKYWACATYAFIRVLINKGRHWKYATSCDSWDFFDILNLVLLYRHGCFTGKYTTRTIHTKLYPGPKWCIFHILTSEDIDNVISRFFTAVFVWVVVCLYIKRTLHVSSNISILCSRGKRSCHSNIKFISSRHRVLSCIDLTIRLWARDFYEVIAITHRNRERII